MSKDAPQFVVTETRAEYDERKRRERESQLRVLYAIIVLIVAIYGIGYIMDGIQKFTNSLNQPASPSQNQETTQTTAQTIVTTTPTLELMLHFDETSGTPQDSSVNGFMVTVNGASAVEGISGNALSFDGIDDYVTVDSNGALSFDAANESYTVELWLKVNDFSGPGDSLQIIKDRPIGLNTWHSYGIYVTFNAETLGNNIYNGVSHDIKAPDPLEIDQWCYVTLVVTANQDQKMYVNGNFVSSGNLKGIGSTKGNTGSITIGAGWYPDGIQLFNGVIDEVAIYRGALSESEIMEHYNAVLT